MKKCVTILTLFLYTTLLHGQSQLSIDLGTEYPQVISFLNAKELVQINTNEENLILVRTAKFHVSYHFHNDVLYKTELTITYPKQKDAEVTTTAMRNYYAMAQSEVMELDNEKEHVRFAALHHRELHEVVQIRLDKNAVQVRQTKLDLDRCPGSDLMELRDDEVLFSMLYR